MEDNTCVKCGIGDSDEKLTKIYKSGYKGLKEISEKLNFNELTIKINNKWKEDKLRIHQTCRLLLSNSKRKSSSSGI